MRHFLANIVTYTIAALLFIGSAAFAWMRSSQLLLVNETAVVEQYAPPDDLGFRWRGLGEASYASNCSNCHRGDGSGWDEYPGLQPTGAMLALPGGRDYLIDLMLYGLASERWGAPMPRMPHIHDVEMAAVINYMLEAFGGIELGDDAILPAEVAARRGRQLGPRDVDRRRPDVPAQQR